MTGSPGCRLHRLTTRHYWQPEPEHAIEKDTPELDRPGGQKNPAAKKKAITAIAHTLLKIAYQVLKTGTPYQDPGAASIPGGNHPGRSRPGWNASCKGSTRLHHHHHHQPRRPP
jgi:hypothetical protein